MHLSFAHAVSVQIAGRQLSCTATSLSWHPQNNALLVGGSDGGVGIWNAPVPEVSKSSYVSLYSAKHCQFMKIGLQLLQYGAAMARCHRQQYADV